jgi:cbb3-type cytochrome c oxidase subunit III
MTRISALGSAFLITTTLLAQNTGGDRNPFAGDTIAAAAGAKIFAQACQTCHIGDGGGSRAPSLGKAIYAHGATDGEIFRNISNGIPGIEMPAFSSLSAEQTWQLVSYIRSLDPKQAQPAIDSGGDPSKGEEIFFGVGACSTCHGVNGRGGVVGKELSAVGIQDGAALRSKILGENNQHARLNARPNARRA